MYCVCAEGKVCKDVYQSIVWWETSGRAGRAGADETAFVSHFLHFPTACFKNKTKTKKKHSFYNEKLKLNWHRRSFFPFTLGPRGMGCAWVKRGEVCRRGGETWQEWSLLSGGT